jgi:hypothetical protein
MKSPWNSMKSHEPPLKSQSPRNHHFRVRGVVAENPGDLAESSEALASEVTETTHEKYGDIVEAGGPGGRGLDGLADILRMVHVNMI